MADGILTKKTKQEVAEVVKNEIKTIIEEIKSKAKTIAKDADGWIE